MNYFLIIESRSNFLGSGNFFKFWCKFFFHSFACDHDDDDDVDDDDNDNDDDNDDIYGDDNDDSDNNDDSNGDGDRIPPKRK